MRKAKFLFKIDSNTHGKVYINKKWLKYVTNIEIHGEPWHYVVNIEQIIRSNGRITRSNDGIATKNTVYVIGRNKKSISCDDVDGIRYFS